MVEFVKGARVQRPKPVEQQLTLNEASFVMCAVADKHGIRDPEEFLRYMGRAWIAYKRTAESENDEHK